MSGIFKDKNLASAAAPAKGLTGGSADPAGTHDFFTFFQNKHLSNVRLRAIIKAVKIFAIHLNDRFSCRTSCISKRSVV